MRSDVYLKAIHDEIDRRSAPITALDIGCGRGIARDSKPIAGVADRIEKLWGVEPDQNVEIASCFSNVWRSTLEQADIPDSSVDIAFSYFVIEHVENPTEFAEKLYRILKPNGVFIAATVGGKCFFAKAATFFRRLGLDELVLKIAHGSSKTDDYHYPTTYRLNTREAVEAVARNLPWESIELTYLENKEWYYYFPKGFRWCGSVYSQLVRNHVERYSYLFVQMKK
jgi:2-polyprenyl-3-methyl-5-hydroxy-6-metoxy-1,4-benzoquinol methylase